jgi:hypothetical protein
MGLSLLRGAEQFVDIALTGLQRGMQRSGRFKRTVDCFKFSNHRMLSFCSIGTRVGLILFLSALVPLNFCRVQNLIAANQRETLCRDRQTRVHQNSAAGVVIGAAKVVLASRALI